MSKTVSHYQSGWIFPDGTLKEVKIYDHFRDLFEDLHALTFIDFASYSELRAWAEEQYTDAWAEFDAQIEPGEHPCYHNFNCYPDDFITEAVYNAGFARFGAWINELDEVEAETDSYTQLCDEYVNKMMDSVGAIKCYCRQRRTGKVMKKYVR